MTQDIAVPETEALQGIVIELNDFLKFSVTDEASLVLAKNGLDAVAEAKKHETIGKLAEACKAAHAAHKSLTALRDSLLDPLEAIDRHLRDQIAAWDAEQDRKIQELKVTLEQQAEEESADANPWEEAAPTQVVISKPPLPVAGISMRKKPIRIELKQGGFKKLFLHAAALSLAGDDSLLEYFQLVPLKLQQFARRNGKKITEEALPGVQVIDTEKTVARR